MSPNEYIALMYQRLDNLKKSQAFALSVATVQAEMSERIFEKGLDANNSSIGGYSGTDLYVNPTKVRKKFPTVGKTGKDTFQGGKKKGQKHKTGYFETYTEFKKTQGRGDKVDLVLNGDLRNDFNKAPIVNENEITIKVTDFSAKKIDGNEARFGKEIFKLSEEENRLLKEVYRDEILRIFKAQ